MPNLMESPLEAVTRMSLPPKSSTPLGKHLPPKKELFSIIDSDFRYEEVNEAYCEAQNLPRQEIVGRSVESIWGKRAFVEVIRPALEDCFNGHEIRYQAWFEIPAWGPRLFDVSFYPQKNKPGEPPHAVVVSRDITDQPILFEVLEGISTAFRNSLSPVLITDGKGIVQSVNAAFEGMVGTDGKEVTGWSVWHFLQRVDSPASSKHGPLIATGDVPWYGRVALLGKNGARHDCLASFSAIRDSLGVVIGFVGVIRVDKNQIAPSEPLHDVGSLDTLKNFAAGIAHDFNNLLTVILSNADFLRRTSGESSDRLAYIDQIEKAGTRASFLSRQLMTFSRNVENSAVDIDVGPLLRESVRMVGNLLPPTVSLSFYPNPRISPVHVDPTKIHQVFLNLMLNARDAVGEKGNILVRVDEVVIPPEEADSSEHQPRPGKYASLTIEDDGPGVPETLHAKIFEPFFTTKAEGKGTGLGLPNVLTHVRESGGYLHFCTREGEGTVFRILLPAVPDPTSSQSLRAHAWGERVAPPLPTDSKTILLKGPSCLCRTCNRWESEVCHLVSQTLE